MGALPCVRQLLEASRAACHAATRLAALTRRHLCGGPISSLHDRLCYCSCQQCQRATDCALLGSSWPGRLWSPGRAVYDCGLPRLIFLP